MCRRLAHAGAVDRSRALHGEHSQAELQVHLGNAPGPRVVGVDERQHPIIGAAHQADVLRARSAVDSHQHGATELRPGDVIYLDPPYVPLSKTANFAGYAGGFGPADQARLAELYRVLDERGCLLVLSNSDTPEVRALYAGFDLAAIQAARSIGAAGASRVPVGEVVVRNTRRWPTAQRAPLFTESGAAQ